MRIRGVREGYRFSTRAVNLSSPVSGGSGAEKSYGLRDEVRLSRSEHGRALKPSTTSPEDKLPEAFSVFILPVLIGGAISSITSFLSRLSPLNYRKRFEKVLFKDLKLSFDNIEEVARKLSTDKNLARKLLKAGVKRTHQIERYDNKPEDLNRREGEIHLVDGDRAEYGYRGVRYTYFNANRNVRVSAEDTPLGEELYITAYRQSGDMVEVKTIPVTLSGDEVRVGRVMTSMMTKRDYELERRLMKLDIKFTG